MRRWTNKRGGELRKTTAAGLVPLLLLASVPGCTARHMSDWSTVQSVKPGTKTEVQLYKDRSPQGRRKIKGRFVSAAEESITLEPSERVYTDMRTRTFRKSDVRKVSARRPIWDRPAGWATFFATAAFVGVADNSSKDQSLGGPLGYLLFSGLPALLVFFTADKGRIYEVPPKHRDSSRPTGPAAIKAEEPNDSK